MLLNELNNTSQIHSAETNQIANILLLNILVAPGQSMIPTVQPAA
jgi:hypothetical protein